MSFAEFQIRLFAWDRCQQRDWEKVRLLAWHTQNASMKMTKRMPTLEKFMPLGIDSKNKPKISDSQKERFLEEYKSYLEKLKSWRD